MTNPFFTQPFALPNHAAPFNLILPEHYLPGVEKGIEEARANIQAIKNNPDAPTFENTIVALETSGELLDAVTSVFYKQLHCNGSDELHALAEQIGPMSAAFSNDILLDPAIFARVKAVWDQRDKLDLTTEQATLLEESYIGFARNGALLDEAGQKRLREISERMSILSPTFINNATKSSEAFEMWIKNEDDLEGLPESAIEAAKHAADEHGQPDKWLFNLDAPSFVPLMQYSAKRALREEMWRAFSSRAYGDEYDNSANVLEIVRLRHETANLLGYKTYADYTLERRMAENTETVMAFLHKLEAAYKKSTEDELNQIKTFAKEIDGIEQLKPWDVAYYKEKLKERDFNFSNEALRPYFPLEKVLDGMFLHFSKLFGLHFIATEGKYQTWHKDVKVFDVVATDGGAFIGTLFADFFPRKGKKQGAWMSAHRSQGLFHGEVMRPIISITCNFTKPVPGKPSLLTHDEVLTLFHEMGHAVHGLLSNVTYQSLAGVNVKYDFVELPSQVQENWCYEKETMDMISGHYETGEPLPQELFDKIIGVKNFMASLFGLRQISLACLDMAWHSTDPADIKDVAQFEHDVTDRFSFFKERGVMSTSFTHLFGGGYAAGYYSYKWSEVLDADTFEAFKEHGLYDQKTANAYKEHILSRGGTEHPKILYKRFRGREADPDALLRREGLVNK